MNAIETTGKVSAGLSTGMGSSVLEGAVAEARAVRAGGSAPIQAAEAAKPAVLRIAQTITGAERASRETAHLGPRVTFSVDSTKDTVVILVLDPVTREVVRQIPPKEFLEIQRRMDDYLGKLTNAEA